MAVCCLCVSPLSQDHRRKKKFHGASCAVPRKVLRSLSNVDLECLEETRDFNALLCSYCERTLNNTKSV